MRTSFCTFLALILLGAFVVECGAMAQFRPEHFRPPPRPPSNGGSGK